MEKQYEDVEVEEVTTISEEEVDETVDNFEEEVEESKFKAFARKVKKGAEKHGPTILRVAGTLAVGTLAYALGAKSGRKDNSTSGVVAESDYTEVDETPAIEVEDLASENEN